MDITKDNLLLEGIYDSERHRILEAGHLCQMERGEFFLHQGDPANQIYILSAGRAKLTQVTPEGREVLVDYVSPGEIFGAIAVIAHATYPVSAVAAESCQALYWERETLTGLMASYPRLALNVMSVFTQRIRILQDRVRELATERVERRIARTLLRLAHQLGRKVDGGILIDLPLSRENLAEMAGTTIYTISRTLSRWEQQGLVCCGRERVLICSPHSLVVIAEDLPSMVEQ